MAVAEQFESSQLRAADAASNDKLGWAVAVDGEVVAVTALLKASAYVFRRQGAGWAHDPPIVASEGASFGIAVALRGDVLVVGQPSMNTAWTYSFDGQQWVAEAPLRSSHQGFGVALALAEDTLMVGAVTGVHVFAREAGAWVQRPPILVHEGAQLNVSSLALDDDVLIVGNREDAQQGTEAGAVHVFRRQAGIWTHTHKLLAPGGDAGDAFGFSVARWNDVLVVGAPADERDAGRNAGSAHVFRFTGQDWEHEAALASSEGDLGDHFGWSVGISGHALVVGAYNYRSEDFVYQGAGSVFRRRGGAWVEDAILLPSDAVKGSGHGLALSLDMRAGVCVAGAPGAPAGSGAVERTGAAYEFAIEYDAASALDSLLEVVLAHCPAGAPVGFIRAAHAAFEAGNSSGAKRALEGFAAAIETGASTAEHGKMLSQVARDILGQL